MQALTSADIRGKSEYEAMRADFRRRIMATKQRRRALVGDHCSIHFESRNTMLYQVQEMLRAEDSWNRPGAVDEELQAYNALIPGPGEISATMMLEYASPEERAEHLPTFVGIDRHVWLRIGDAEPLRARFDRGQIDERGVSAVQYIKWQLSDAHVSALQRDGTVLRLVIDHPAYAAQAVLSEDTRRELAADFRQTRG
jgi:hypothetical protein